MVISSNYRPRKRMLLSSSIPAAAGTASWTSAVQQTKQDEETPLLQDQSFEFSYTPVSEPESSVDGSETPESSHGPKGINTTFTTTTPAPAQGTKGLNTTFTYSDQKENSKESKDLDVFVKDDSKIFALNGRPLTEAQFAEISRNANMIAEILEAELEEFKNKSPPPRLIRSGTFKKEPSKAAIIRQNLVPPGPVDLVRSRSFGSASALRSAVQSQTKAEAVEVKKKPAKKRPGPQPVRVAHGSFQQKRHADENDKKKIPGALSRIPAPRRALSSSPHRRSAVK